MASLRGPHLILFYAPAALRYYRSDPKAGPRQSEFTMKAIYLTGLKQMELRQAPDPRPGGPHDVLLRVDTLGVCGSDIHYYTQGQDRVTGGGFSPITRP